MKKRKYRTIDGGTIELNVPETPEEQEEAVRKARAGEIDDSDGFNDASDEDTEE